MYLTANQIYSLTGTLMQQFETISSGKMLFVHKVPKKLLVNDNATIYDGYGVSSNPGNFTLIPVSGIFPCMRVYTKDTLGALLEDIQTKTLEGEVRIKVKQDARNFIQSGKNEIFELEGMTFQNAIEETPQNYLGLKFYYFTLKKTL